MPTSIQGGSFWTNTHTYTHTSFNTIPIASLVIPWILAIRVIRFKAVLIRTEKKSRFNKARSPQEPTTPYPSNRCACADQGEGESRGDPRKEVQGMGDP